MISIHKYDTGICLENNFTIPTTLPKVIKARGVFCLQKNFQIDLKNGPAITITQNSTTVDFNGYTINNNAKDNSAVGVYGYNKHSVTIRNGTLRGFLDGIDLTQLNKGQSRGNLVENMTVDKIRQVGIYVNGDNNIVRNNRVLNVGPYCIPGTGCMAWGIAVRSGRNVQIENNIISKVKANGSGIAYGIHIFDMTDAFVVNNRVANTSYGVAFSQASGKYRDNLTSSISSKAFVNGYNAGNNY